jgi:DNA-directed RNA polymerase subunit alpha
MLDEQLYSGGEYPVPQETSAEPRIEVREEVDNYCQVVAAPLPPGFGTTLGNSLRRVLLSSLPGAAVTSLRIDGVLHEFSTIPHVREDTIEFLLNVKEVRLRALSDRPGVLVLDVAGHEGEVTAADVQVPEHYEIANPDLHLATLDSPEGRLHVEFNVEVGRGYVPAGQRDGLPLGTIPVDAIFSPVRKVNYRVEHTRVGQAANYDKLVLEVWTDGTIEAVKAVSQSADIIIEHFRLFGQVGKPEVPVVKRGLGVGVALSPETYNMPVEELQLSMRAYNCLRRSGLMTVGEILQKSEEELLALRNFGRKSYEELRRKFEESGLVTAEQPEEEIAEAPSLEEEEEPFPVPLPAARARSAQVEVVSPEAEAEAVPAEEEGLAAHLTPQQLKELLKFKEEAPESEE